MTKKQKIDFNKSIAPKIEMLSNVIGELNDLLENEKDENKKYQLQEALETIVSGRDELYDLLYTYEVNGGDFVYYGLEGWIL